MQITPDEIRLEVERLAFEACRNGHDVILISREWYNSLSRSIGGGRGELFYQGPRRIKIKICPSETLAYTYKEDFL